MLYSLWVDDTAFNDRPGEAGKGEGMRKNGNRMAFQRRLSVIAGRLFLWASTRRCR
jgi:hypothetical protein